jgi:transcriptional regulator with XRE-family HTH domain
MFNTVFDDKLDDFIYGKTCTANSYGHARQGKGIIANSAAARFTLSGLAIGTLLSTPMLLRSPNSLAQGFVSIQKIKAGYAAKIDRLDDRTRQELARRVIRNRHDFKLSQEDLGHLLNISPSTISKFERGEHSPDFANLAKYNKFLELADYLQKSLNGKKYAIRQLFSHELSLFGDKTSIEYATILGDEGINEVISSFKRLYG